MFSLTFLGIFIVVLASATSTSVADDTPYRSDVTGIEIKVLEIKTTWEDFLRESGLIQVARSQNGKKAIRYTFGSRDISKDTLVSQGSGWRSSSIPQNYQLRLDYPSNGEGAVVTYVEIEVQQSSKLGRAYIISGGTKQRKIEIMVEGNNTNLLKYSYKIYGIYE